MKRTVIISTALALCALMMPAAAFADAQERAIQKLGEINGMALYCKRVSQVQSIRQAIVSIVPPLPEFAVYFEDATAKAFDDAIDKRRPCPVRGSLEIEVRAGVKRLRAAFGKE